VSERGASLNVIRVPGAGGSSGCGATRRGASNVLNAFRSGPVSVSHAFHAETDRATPHRNPSQTDFEALPIEDDQK